MKKILCLFALIFALPIFAACSSEDSSAENRNTSTTPTVSDVLEEQMAQSEDSEPEVTEPTEPEISEPEILEPEVDEPVIPQAVEPEPDASIPEPTVEPTVDTAANSSGDSEIDIDLTTLSANMVYAEVYSMMMNPEPYIGKIIKMDGTFFTFQNPETGYNYFTCIITDALACCSTGIEFILIDEENYTFPDDYPAIDEEIMVIGEFETYDEWGMLFARLKDAKFVTE